MFFQIPSINKSFNEVVWKYSGVYNPLQGNFDDFFSYYLFTIQILAAKMRLVYEHYVRCKIKCYLGIRQTILEHSVRYVCVILHHKIKVSNKPRS